MRTVVILEYDFASEAERDAVVREIRREVPAVSLLSVRLAEDPIAAQIVESCNPPKHKR